jgi:phosphoenolpyruvate carboxylase
MQLSTELKGLVRESVALLGRVIERELGPKSFTRIEAIRKQMSELREVEDAYSPLHELFVEMQAMSRSQRQQLAHAFTLMLELMNSCENAYRSNSLVNRPAPQAVRELPQAIIYVLTAHPTEARSPQNISVFHQIQNLLVGILQRSPKGEDLCLSPLDEEKLFHLLEVAWHTPIVRHRTPKVSDEAEHIYSLIFRDETLQSLLDDLRDVPFFLRSWVGGDKDGHPLVDERTLLQSFSLSRQRLLQAAHTNLKAVRQTLQLFSAPRLLKGLAALEKSLQPLKSLKAGDGTKVARFKVQLSKFSLEYETALGALHPGLQQLKQLCVMFPGIVVPLELRETAEMLRTGGKNLAIGRMLQMIHKLAGNSDPRFYARGFILSMCESIEHIRMAAQLELKIFSAIRIPIIPLFEEASSLQDSEHIVRQMVEDKTLHQAAKKYWDSIIELMVGYSDSAKEAGVLSSRLAIAEALPPLARVCESAGLIPEFFHGSGGSVDRGGGSIEDQTAWWPRAALRRYKVTVQGEMVERSFATPAIARGQIQHIMESASRGLSRGAAVSKDPTLDAFAARVSQAYREQVGSPQFLHMVEQATPYSFLNVLKMGSRPSKRTRELSVKGLRAIPWVLCWTQTRVLFPTWWGIGQAWSQSSKEEKLALKKAFESQPVFTSYIKALGFTLAKVELSIFRLYLENSGLTKEEANAHYQAFAKEFELTLKAYREICAQQNLMWFRPWLGESIALRSPMIHPLNLLQILAHQDHDVQLLRLTVTGISSGMLTTG